MLLIQLAIILLFSKIAGHLSVRLGQPSVLGKLLVGILLGPSVLGLISNSDILQQLSQIGVILLMFIAGIETDLDEFKKTAKASTIVGVFGVIAPMILGYVAGITFGMTTLQSLFLGLLLAATSVSISVQSLKELGKLQTKAGNTILGAAVIDDVLVIVALAFVMSLAGGDVHIGTILWKKAVFFLVIFVAAWKFVPMFLKYFSYLKVSETIVTAGLIVCFSFAYFADYMGIAAIIGSYIAGVAISMTNYKKVIFEKTEALGYSLFVPIFFTSIGLSAQFSGILENWVLILVISIVAIVSKLIGCAIGAKVSHFTWRNSFGIGAAMVSRGEVALIIAAIGLEKGLIEQSMFSIIVIVVLITTILTAPLMKIFFNERGKEVVAQ
ncbi:cation:proton antiporter [Ectobacillus sp. sgz5001026]|uniref:cation:proton antiporter n=1 Tax=Ectobacillus sp. sgz5001026 TaxID=3242473 RepID=UPI0036D2A121